jgi:hypothetical protein
MTTRYAKNIFLLILTTVVFACKDTLDTNPPGNPNSENFWKTETEANKALIACYAKLKEPIISNGPAQSGNFLFGRRCPTMPPIPPTMSRSMS